jgi:hypothetical protein
VKLARALLLAALAAGLLPGCALKTDYRAMIHGYIENTMAVARAFSYQESHAGHTAEVQGRIADDLRWEATYTMDGRPMAHEIVVDESRALQVSDPTVLAGIKTAQPGGAPAVPAEAGAPATAPTPSPGASPAPSASPSPAGGAVSTQQASGAAPATLAALRTGQWVLDPAGARNLVLASTGGHPITIGADPIGDSLRMLRQADLALDRYSDQQVTLFSPEAGNYFADLDPFRRPVPGETRYDVNPAPQLATRSGLEISAAQRKADLPLYDYFQSLAIYVRHGLVDEVRWSESVPLRLQLPDQDILARISDAGYSVPARMYSASRQAQASFIVKTLNSYYRELGLQQLREREQIFVLSNLGQDQGSLSIPPGLQHASLTGVFDRGQLLGRAD